MKIVLLSTLFFITVVSANYAFNDEKTVKIDMHGGKSETYTNSNGFLNKNFKKTKTLQSMTITKPVKPTSPTVKDIKYIKDVKVKYRKE